MGAAEWEGFCVTAMKHSVLPLLYEALAAEELPDPARKIVEGNSRQVVRQSYHLLFLTRYFCEYFQGKGLFPIVLKGAAIASYYPVPELRKSGDVDLLFPAQGDFEKACALMEECGFLKKEKQYHNHHIEFVGQDGIIVELHGMLVEPFADSGMNQWMEGLLHRCQRHMAQRECCGIAMPTFSDGLMAYYLLLHMLQHFLLAGFGLRYLCDWVMFWNRDVGAEEIQLFCGLADESGIMEFANAVTACCVHFLGLPKERAHFLEYEKVTQNYMQDFLRDILDSGEFGQAEEERMVGLQGTGPLAYAQEFHHQMRINFPNAGRHAALWPALWALTLLRFLHNNHSIRRVSGFAILKKARLRSRLIGRLNLFQI